MALAFFYALFPFSVHADQDLNVSAVVVISEENGGEEGGNTYGSYGYENSPTTVNFSGQAYPFAKITLLKNGYIASSVVADSNGFFNTALTNLSPGNNFFAIYADDAAGRRSTTFSIMLFLTKGFTTTVSGIFIPPTISLSTSHILQGQSLSISGASVPLGTVALSIFSKTYATEVVKYALSMEDGTYMFALDTTSMPLGVYEIKAKTLAGTQVSGFSSTAVFSVVDSFLPPEEIVCSQKGDLNSDCKVNLIDFSILEYWYRRTDPPTRVDLNSDGRITMSDFSILAYNWTD